MPSGWATSGINWTSVATMRNSRTEDIVRELYLAVNEREHFINYTIDSITIPSLDTIGRLRMENQIRYIYNTVKKWLLPSNELADQGLLDNQELSTYCCFIDSDTLTTPVFTPGLNNFAQGLAFYSNHAFIGWDNYNYEENGNFESDYSLNLGFLRDDNFFNNRHGLEWLFTIKSILDLSLHIPTRKRFIRYNASATNGAYTYIGSANIYNQYDSSADEARYYIADEITIPTENNYNDANIAYKDPANRQFKGGSIFFHLNEHAQNWEYDVFSFNKERYFGESNFGKVRLYLKGRAQSFNVSELSLINRSFGSEVFDRWVYSNNGQFEYAPTGASPFSGMSYGHITKDFTVENLSNSQISAKWSWGTPYVGGEFISYDSHPSDLFPYNPDTTYPLADKDVIYSSNINAFVDINKEGFLKYYTEATN